MAVETKTYENFIGGEWVDAASGETFESRSPATGELIGVFPKSGREDVDRARRRRPRGVRGVASRPGAGSRRDPLPLRRARPRAQGRAFPADVARDGEGAPRGRRRRPGSDRHELLHGGRGPTPVRPDDPLGAPRQVQHERAHADRRDRRDHPVELPDRDPVLEDRARARLREHGRLQAGDRHAGAGRALRRAARRGRRPGRGRERGARGWGSRRRTARPAPGRSRDHADRVARDGRRGDEGRRGQPQARPSRARRQERGDRARRCRSRPRGRGDHLVGVRHLRAALHRCLTGRRARAGLRGAPVEARRRRREDAPRPGLGAGHRRRAGDQRAGAREDPLLHRHRPGRGREDPDRRRGRNGQRARERLLLPADDLRATSSPGCASRRRRSSGRRPR